MSLVMCGILTDEVKKLNVDITQLNQRIQVVETESRQKTETVRYPDLAPVS